jgi:hypothetical protein
MENIRKELFENKSIHYIRLAMEQPDVNKTLFFVKELFDFMTSNLWWMKHPSMKNVLKWNRIKLKEFKEDKKCNKYYKEYFRNTQETLGFETYCCYNTSKNYRCANNIKREKNNKYCKLHKKLLKKKSERISEFIGSSDVSMLITQYL